LIAAGRFSPVTTSMLVEPMTLQNMRENGVRSLAVQCHQCRHEMIINVDHLPGDLPVSSFGPRMVCTKCGTIIGDGCGVGSSSRGSAARRAHGPKRQQIPGIKLTRR
jgi:hypothetical protein